MTYYLGLFCLAFSTLALEVTLVRLLSVMTWYHLAFFAISTAMLGMTAGAVRVYLQPDKDQKVSLAQTAGRFSLIYSVTVPLSLIVLCSLPLDMFGTAMTILVFFIATIICALPFYFAGVVIAAVLTRCPLPVGRLYASDLAGASLGCLFVLGGLEIFDAPSLILLCGAIGAAAAALFNAGQPRRRGSRAPVAIAVILVLAAFANAATSRGIRPVIVKGTLQNVPQYLIERWNSFSRVVVFKAIRMPPNYWGPSPLAPAAPINQFYMNIDGDAGTVMQKFEKPADIDFLRYDATTVGYNLDRPGPVCVIGVGGGRDIQSALLFGHDQVLGVEVNGIFVDLLQNAFRDFAGVAGRPGVRLVTDDARSYLTRTPERFSIIQMALIDTWAATGAGAFSLTENSLYTLEAWSMFLDRLNENGLFMVSRWHNPKNLGETGRAASLAVGALMKIGVQNPSRHIAMITCDRICTLLISRKPFSEQDLLTLRKICREMQFQIACLPDQLAENSVLRQILAAPSPEALSLIGQTSEMNYVPPTDENPYFFNMLRLKNIFKTDWSQGGVLSGNLLATITLLLLLGCLSVLVVVTIIVPLLWGEVARDKTFTRSIPFWSGAVYFSTIGAGFMFLEIALMQKLSIFLGHPVYALGILLFSLIASTGLGSFISEKLPLSRRPWTMVYPVIAFTAILVSCFALRVVLAQWIAKELMIRIAASVGLIFPLGILLGFFFPTGMKIARQTMTAVTPWFWALNGIFGVLCSAVAVFISIYASISINFYIAAACYLLTIPCLALIQVRTSRFETAN